MSKNEAKKVDLEFIPDELLCKSISLEGPSQPIVPIAERTRSKMKYSSASKSKSNVSTPNSRKSTQSSDRTPSRRTRSSSKCSPIVKNDKGSPFISKAFKPGCSSKEGKVTPLKIDTKLLSENHTPPSDLSSSEDLTPKVLLKPSLFIKKLKLSDSIPLSSPLKKNTPTKEKESAPSLNGCRTPKTPRLTNDDYSDTPKTRSTTRRLRSSSITPKTPSARKALNFIGNNEVCQTPYGTRSKLKKGIQTLKSIDEDELEEDDFESMDSGDSEYSATDSQLDSDNEGTEFDSDYQGTPAKRNRLSVLQKNEISSPSTLYRITPQKKITHHNVLRLDSEEYFEKKSLKNITSNNVLSKLPLPEVSDISKISSNKYVKHQHEINCLTTKYREQFTMWLLYLKEGFNLILYGLGSKIEILKQFHSERLSDSCVLRVNGFNNNFSINEMIKALMKEILQISRCPANLIEALNLATKELEQNEIHVFIIIDNIDGIALRGAKKQIILSKLAESPFVHIIASLDHINASLLWGNNKMSCFNFVWLDVTTFNCYATEISYQKSIDIENSGSDSSLVLLNKVFNWQGTRNKEVFELIVKDFWNKNKKNFKGTLTNELLRLANKNLSITSKSVLLSSLTDFIENNIIHVEHNYLKFLVHPNVVRSFYKQHFSQK